MNLETVWAQRNGKRAKGTAANLERKERKERAKGTAKSEDGFLMGKYCNAAKDKSAPRLSVARAQTMYAHTNTLHTQ